MQGTLKRATHLRNMNRIEAQCQLFRNIRYMEEKLSAGSMTQVTVTSPDGRTTELTQRDKVEKAVMAENERKFNQTEGGSQLLSDRFVRDIRKFNLLERPTESVVSRYWNLVKAWKIRNERTASANHHIRHSLQSDNESFFFELAILPTRRNSRDIRLFPK